MYVCPFIPQSRKIIQKDLSFLHTLIELVSLIKRIVMYRIAYWHLATLPLR